MKLFDYYLQNDGTQSLRRYPIASQIGERWRRDNRAWSPECAPRLACELTGDKVLNDTEVEAAMR